MFSLWLQTQLNALCQKWHHSVSGICHLGPCLANFSAPSALNEQQFPWGTAVIQSKNRLQNTSAAQGSHFTKQKHAGAIYAPVLWREHFWNDSFVQKKKKGFHLSPSSFIFAAKVLNLWVPKWFVSTARLFFKTLGAEIGWKSAADTGSVRSVSSKISPLWLRIAPPKLFRAEIMSRWSSNPITPCYFNATWSQQIWIWKHLTAQRAEPNVFVSGIILLSALRF